VQSFSEKTGINEAIVWEELRHWEDNRSERRDTAQLKSRFFSDQDPRKYGSDLQFLNLLVHYPETKDAFKDKEWELLVSDPEIIKIIRVLMERFPSGGDLGRIEEFLVSPVAREQLRVILMSQPFYGKELVNQAVSEFAKKIAKIKISQSISHAKAEGDMEMLNRLLKAKQDLDVDKKGI
jgi:hypothetical protein